MTGAPEIHEVALPREAARFVRSWSRIHEGTEHWVAPLVGDRKRFFDRRRNPYFEASRVQCFWARRNGRILGTIAATLDRNFEAANPAVGLFGFFEFIEDEAVAKGLFDAACDWLSARGMARVRGPFSFNSNHEFGLQVNGFDTWPAITTIAGAKYYPEVYERLGLAPVMDWYSYRLPNIRTIPGRLVRLEEFVLSRRPGLRVRSLNLRSWEQEVRILHELYNVAWARNWSFVAMSLGEFRHLADSMRPLIDPDLCCIAELDGRPVAMAVALPDYNQVLRKMDGRLLPFGWFHLLRGRRRIDTVLVLIAGARPEYEYAGLGAPMYARLWRRSIELGMREATTSLVLESNRGMRGGIEKLGGVIDRTYRTYEKTL